MNKKDLASQPAWMSETTHGTVIRLYIQPGASRSEIVGEHGDGESARLKIRVASPPVDGAANEALIRLLSDRIGVARGRIHVIRGTASRSKDVLIDTIPMKDVLRAFS